MELLKHLNLHLEYLDDLLNIDNPYFEGMVSRIYPPELQLTLLMLFTTFVDSVGYPRYNPQKTRKQ